MRDGREGDGRVIRWHTVLCDLLLEDAGGTLEWEFEMVLGQAQAAHAPAVPMGAARVFPGTGIRRRSTWYDCQPNVSRTERNSALEFRARGNLMPS